MGQQQKKQLSAIIQFLQQQIIRNINSYQRKRRISKKQRSCFILCDGKPASFQRLENVKQLKDSLQWLNQPEINEFITPSLKDEHKFTIKNDSLGLPNPNIEIPGKIDQKENHYCKKIKKRIIIQPHYIVNEKLIFLIKINKGHKKSKFKEATADIAISSSCQSVEFKRDFMDRKIMSIKEIKEGRQLKRKQIEAELQKLTRLQKLLVKIQHKKFQFLFSTNLPFRWSWMNLKNLKILHTTLVGIIQRELQKFQK